MGSIVTIGNQTYSGNSIIISNNKITIDGIDVTPDSKEINITVNGNIDELRVDNCKMVSVVGDVKNIKTMSGGVDVTGGVDGNIKTMSGSVDCGGSVGGSITTISGNIKHKI
jgi:hypothetical protein